MALVHDLSEALLMDIPMPYADAYLRDAKQEAEQAIMEDLFEGFPMRRRGAGLAGGLAEAEPGCGRFPKKNIPLCPPSKGELSGRMRAVPG